MFKISTACALTVCTGICFETDISEVLNSVQKVLNMEEVSTYDLENLEITGLYSEIVIYDNPAIPNLLERNKFLLTAPPLGAVQAQQVLLVFQEELGDFLEIRNSVILAFVTEDGRNAWETETGIFFVQSPSMFDFTFSKFIGAL